MNKQLKEIEIPFGAKDSEFCGWEYTIPEEMEATIINNKIVVKKKESDDERIKKNIKIALMSMEDNLVDFYSTHHTSQKELIAWLEKQGEQKPADKVEPKFKVGDWIVNTITNEIGQVIELTDYEYICSGHLIVSFNNQHLLKRWTIENAKDGDILADGNLPFIFKKIDANKYSYVYCGISVDDGFKIESEGEFGEWTWMQDIKPATKEQRNLLFQKMKEAGYEWDAEKKELKKIEQKPANEEMKIILQTEYEKGRADAIAEFQKEWSEEDKRIIEDASKYIREYANQVQGTYSKRYVESIADRIESFRPQTSWKPSVKQLEALEHFLGDYNITIFKERYKTLTSLYQDLKKLRKK